VAHVVPGYNASKTNNAVDGDPVPVPHFGAALSVEEFHSLASRIKGAGVSFVIEPHLRFEGKESKFSQLPSCVVLGCFIRC
jgi:uncharacterized protein